MVLSDGVPGPTDFPRSQCCLLLRLTFLYNCSVFSRLLVLLRRSRTPSIASAGPIILLISTLLPVIQFPRRSWSRLREGYYTLLPNFSLDGSLVKKIADVGLDPNYFAWHSFRSGGAPAAANGGISDRMFKLHCRWRPENAKDGYFAYSLESRVAVSMSLGL